MDTKHSNLIHVSGTLPAWVDSAHAGNLRRLRDAVHSRTFCEVYIDRGTREVVFGYHNEGDVRPVYTWPLFRHYHSSIPNKFEASNDFEIGVDDVCYVIQLARVDPARKSVWEKHRKTSTESARQNRMGSIIQDGIAKASKDQERTRRKPVTA